MGEKTTALVTGANKGIGYEIAAGLGRRGMRVGVGARDDGRRAEAVARLQADGVDAFGVPLDVTSDASVVAAAELLTTQEGRLDVVVNNAGITGGTPQDPSTADLAMVRGVLEVNVFGVIRVVNATLPLLRQAPSPRIVIVTSSVGSLERQRDHRDQVGPITIAYAPSKTYLNGVALAYVRELEGSGILLNLVCPGYVATDLNGFRGTRTTEQGAARAIAMATIPDDGPNGTFTEDAGTVPW